MAQTVVDVVVKTAGGSKLDQLANKLKQTEAALAGLNSSIKKQGAANAELAKKLRGLKGTYSEIENAAKGSKFSEATIAKLKKLKQEIDDTRDKLRQGLQAKVKSTQDLDRLQRELKQTQTEFKKTEAQAKKSSGGIAGALRTIAGAYAAIQLTKFVVNSLASFERIEKQLTTVTGSAETARKVFNQLEQVNIESPFELTELTQAAAKLSAFGVENDKLVETTKRLGKIAAGTSQEIGGIALAYGQVLAKGRLQGEELLQFVERGVPLQKELQRMLGLTGEEFAEAMRKGKIGVELVDKAVENLTDEQGKFGKAFENTSGTIDNKLSNMRDQFAKTAAALGKAFEPQFKFLIDSITKVAQYFESVFKRITRGQKGLAAEQAAQQKATQFTRDRFGAVRSAAAALTGDQEVLDFREKAKNSALQNELARVDRELAELRGEIGKPTLPKAPTASATEIQENRNLLLGNDDGKGTGIGKGSSAAAKKTADELERQKQAIKEGLRASELSLAVMKQELQVSKAAAGLDRQQEALALDKLRINQQYDALMRDALKNEMSDQQKINIELERGLALRKASLDTQQSMMKTAQGEFQDFFKQQPEYAGLFNDELTETEKLLKGSYDIIANNLSSAIQGLVDGTKEWSDVLSDVLGQLGQMFINAGLNGLGAGMGIPGFADGGRPPVGKPSIVGEEGPELFIPDIAGTIVSNPDLFALNHEALDGDDEVVATEDDEDKTKDAIAANNSSIANTYNSSTDDTESALTENSESINNTYNTTNNGEAEAEAAALAENSESLNNTYSTTNNADAEATALAENSESINNTYNQSTSSSKSTSNEITSSTSSALQQNRDSIASAYAVNQNYIAAQQMRQSQNAQTEALSSALEPMPTQSFDIKYESMNIGGMEVVTPAQLEKATRVSAMKGRDMALASLKNSVRARKGIGLA